MRATGLRRPDPLDAAWLAFALLNVAAMLRWPRWETIPFHLIWFTLTLLYGFRVWALAADLRGADRAGTRHRAADRPRRRQRHAGVGRAVRGPADVGDVPRHGLARPPPPRGVRGRGAPRCASAPRCSRARSASCTTSRTSCGRRSRSPAGISRSCAGPRDDAVSPEVVGGDRRARPGWSASSSGCCCSCAAGPAEFARTAEDIDLDTLIEDVTMRWAEIAPRVWRVGDLPHGTLRIDRDALRIALDALVENAVAHTEPTDAIELRASKVRRPGGDRGGRRGLRDPGRDARPDLRTLRRAPTRPASAAARASAWGSRSSRRSRTPTADAAPCRARPPARRSRSCCRGSRPRHPRPWRGCREPVCADEVAGP